MFKIGTTLALATAITVAAIAGPTVAAPANGTCKAGTEQAFANSPAAAQQLWIATVSQKYGTKWAHWVGAKNKAIVPVNGGAQFLALATPCFYQPVL